jgi:CDP-diacylglycerol--glycerol-3-phosphate 3-phosphatidyltransferase
MKLFNSFLVFIEKIKYRDKSLFTYLKADEVHHHDIFLHTICLQFLPSSVTPNKLTMLRILMTPVVFLTVAYGNYSLGVFLFLLAAFTDALDGSLARTQDKITRFGMLFDPLADKLLIGSMILLLVFTHFNFWLGIALLGFEIIFIVSALVSTIKFKTERMANVWGKVKMVAQVVAVFLTLMALLLENPYFLSLAAWVFGIAIGFAFLSLFRQGI